MNVGNIVGAPPYWPRPCNFCQALVPNRARIGHLGKAETSYDRVDYFPAFHGLVSTAQAGCLFCSVILPVAIGETVHLALWESLEFVRPGTSSDFLDYYHHRPVLLQEPVRIEIAFQYSMHNSVHYANTEGPVNNSTLLWGDSLLPPADFDRWHEGLTVEHGVRGHDCFSCGLPREQFCRLIGMNITFSFVNYAAAEEKSTMLRAFDWSDLGSPSFERRTRIPDPWALGPDNADMMRRWIHNCVQDHAYCKRHSETWVPTRLLDITIVPSSSDFQIRLVTTATAEVPPESHYAALSHMWGDLKVQPPILRTTMATIDSFHHEIPLNILPRNLVEAAMVCIQLNIRYLWIDSLCIIQDSPEDWNHEAALMHKVYRDAFVTLVATSATSSHDGFLNRDLRRFPAVKLTYPIIQQMQRPAPRPPSPKPFWKRSKKTAKVASAPVPPPNMIPQNSGYMVLCKQEWQPSVANSIEGSRWNTRGWTFQERQLSTRMIHFCHDRLVFECRSCVSTEDIGVDAGGGGLMRSDEKIVESGPELYKQWSSMLRSYNLRDLSEGKDKLPAIRGIAESIAPGLGLQYLPFAGMWRELLRWEIFWRPDRYQESKLKGYPQRTRAPSWSWASLDGPIELGIGGTDSVGGIIEPSKWLDIVDVLPPAPGTVAEHGALVIRAMTKRITTLKRKDDGRQHLLGEEDLGEGAPPFVFAEGLFDVYPLDTNRFPRGTSTFMYMHSGGVLGLILNQVDTGSSEVVWKRVGDAKLLPGPGNYPNLLHPRLFTDANPLERLMIV